jgi:gliding motility-associated protein GldE
MNSTDPGIHSIQLAAGTLSINSSALVISFIILVILLFISALSSGAESAFYSLGPKEKEKLRSNESKAAKTSIKLLEHPKELLATLLITNNFVNIAIIILSSYIIHNIFHLAQASEGYYFLFEIIGITLTVLLLGEVIPKIYSSRNPVRIATLTSIPISTIGSIPPISWLKVMLVSGTNLMQRLTRETTVKINAEELEQAIALTKESAGSEEEQRILEGIVRFGNTETCQIMRSRLEVVAVDQSEKFSSILTTIRENGYSRIPVFKDSFDQVIGILYIKDLLPYLEEGNDFNWNKVVRKPFFVPENKKIDDLLKEFQEKKMHMAIVVDEYGGSAGVITLEDILEEIIGDINDEFDGSDILYSRISEDTFLFEGRTTLVDFIKIMETEGKEFEQKKGDTETLGGFIVEQAGRILKNNEFIITEGIKMIVESSDKRRIRTVKAIKLNKVGQ